VIQVSSFAKIKAHANTSPIKGRHSYETTGRIRVGPESKAIPIIAVTSYALAGDEAKALAAGCNAYVTKPYLCERCPLWVKSRHLQRKKSCPLYPQKMG
jgi:CheY-like chemotaxis protein